MSPGIGFIYSPIPEKSKQPKEMICNQAHSITFQREIKVVFNTGNA